MKPDESNPNRPGVPTYQGRGTDIDTRRIGRRNVMVPIGGIIAFNGALSTIPPNWHLCDGTMGTPNLIGLFIKCVATAATNPGATGGSVGKNTTGHVHAQNMGAFTGNTAAGYAYSMGGNGTPIGMSNGAGSATAVYTGVSGSVDSISDIRPPYYELAYIMRIS
jgi:hypothetical protein